MGCNQPRIRSYLVPDDRRIAMNENIPGWTKASTRLSIQWPIRILIMGNSTEKHKYRERAARFFQPHSEPIMTIPEVTNPRYLAVNAYEKPGMGLELLRYDILGEATI